MLDEQFREVQLRRGKWIRREFPSAESTLTTTRPLDHMGRNELWPVNRLGRAVHSLHPIFVQAAGG